MIINFPSKLYNYNFVATKLNKIKILTKNNHKLFPNLVKIQIYSLK